MIQSLRVLLGLGVLFVGSHAWGQVNPVQPGGKSDPPKDTKKKVSWRHGDWPIYEIGTVTEVSSTSITITRQKGGKTVQLPPHVALASGGWMKDATNGDSYRLQDVKVGDFVCLGAVKEDDGKTYCIGICIEKRPGGRLPQCPAWDSELSPSHADYRNAIDDLNEKGIPLPDKVRRRMSSQDVEAVKSDDILRALKAKTTPPEKIEKLKD